MGYASRLEMVGVICLEQNNMSFIGGYCKGMGICLLLFFFFSFFSEAHMYIALELVEGWDLPDRLGSCQQTRNGAGVFLGTTRQGWDGGMVAARHGCNSGFP